MSNEVKYHFWHCIFLESGHVTYDALQILVADIAMKIVLSCSRLSGITRAGVKSFAAVTFTAVNLAAVTFAAVIH